MDLLGRTARFGRGTVRDWDPPRRWGLWGVSLLLLACGVEVAAAQVEDGNTVYFWETADSDQRQPSFEASVPNALDNDYGLTASPSVPRPRKRPCRLEDGGAPQHAFKTPEDVYRQLYYDVIDTAVTSLDTRFSPSVFDYMKKVEDFLTGKKSCESIIEFHGDDLDETRVIETQARSAAALSKMIDAQSPAADAGLSAVCGAAPVMGHQSHQWLRSAWCLCFFKRMELSKEITEAGFSLTGAQSHSPDLVPTR
uniref:Uncharacterized protein n=1 Tax=Knipowitschia caucasica TaxID=637954 RepID=A0AAV2MH35_KNICA